MYAPKEPSLPRKPNKCMFFFGTRPEIIKLAPIIKRARPLWYPVLVHTGQHFDDKMYKIFIDELELPLPITSFNVGTKRFRDRAAVIKEIANKTYNLLLEHNPKHVIVQGDTNSGVGAALGALKYKNSYLGDAGMQFNIHHVEAGLRSYDPTMPEELNRVILDEICDILWPPTEIAQDNLPDAHDGDIMEPLGNTCADALHDYNKKFIEPSDPKDILVTLHRPFNVDDKIRLDKILYEINIALHRHNWKAIIPVHPRLKEVSWPDRIQPVDPMGYFEFIGYLKKAKMVITDSGGLQEEACHLDIPCVTVRPNTERPETLNLGANILAEPEEIPNAVETMRSTNSWLSPYCKYMGESNEIAERLTW